MNFKNILGQGWKRHVFFFKKPTKKNTLKYNRNLKKAYFRFAILSIIKMLPAGIERIFPTFNIIAGNKKAYEVI